MTRRKLHEGTGRRVRARREGFPRATARPSVADPAPPCSGYRLGTADGAKLVAAAPVLF